jgi:hypothetical protein
MDVMKRASEFFQEEGRFEEHDVFQVDSYEKVSRQEFRRNRVARRAGMFLRRLEQLCDRPEVNPDDTELSLAIFDAAARAQLESPAVTEAPEWAKKAFLLLDQMRPRLPELMSRRLLVQEVFEKLFPEKVGPLHETDPDLYFCQIRARDFFFNFGMPEAEGLLTCCLLAYADGWVPSNEFLDLEPVDYVMAELSRDLWSTLTDKAIAERDVQKRNAHALIPFGLSVLFGALVLAGLGGPAFMSILLVVVAVAVLVCARQTHLKFRELQHEVATLQVKAAPRRRKFPQLPSKEGLLVWEAPCHRCGAMGVDVLTSIYGCASCR